MYYNIHSDLPTSNKYREVHHFSHRVIPLTHSESTPSPVSGRGEKIGSVRLLPFSHLCCLTQDLIFCIRVDIMDTSMT